jgi:hypothetical protein
VQNKGDWRFKRTRSNSGLNRETQIRRPAMTSLMIYRVLTDVTVSRVRSPARGLKESEFPNLISRMLQDRRKMILPIVSSEITGSVLWMLDLALLHFQSCSLV